LGEPIPIIHCSINCGLVPVPEEDLPVRLPDVERYQPTGTGESPLAAIHDWVNTRCPNCGGPAQRETDTMPQWAGSSWYFLRYASPRAADVLITEKGKAVGAGRHVCRRCGARNSAPLVLSIFHDVSP
jgi:leucyl-tRNA synthetase